MKTNPIGRPALIAAIIGPIQAVLGWVISGALWPGGFDHLTKTISDLTGRFATLHQAWRESLA